MLCFHADILYSVIQVHLATELLAMNSELVTVDDRDQLSMPSEVMTMVPPKVTLQHFRASTR